MDQSLFHQSVNRLQDGNRINGELLSQGPNAGQTLEDFSGGNAAQQDFPYMGMFGPEAG